MDATSVQVTTLVLGVVATLAVGGRFWARKLKKQRYGLEDWTVLASLVRGRVLVLIMSRTDVSS
jgi:hypothetical protein